VHLYEWVVAQVVAIVEQEDHLRLRGADVAIKLHRPVVEDVRHGPLLVVERPAGDEEVAVLELFEELDIGGNCWVNDFPFRAAIGE